VDVAVNAYNTYGICVLLSINIADLLASAKLEESLRACVAYNVAYFVKYRI